MADAYLWGVLAVNVAWLALNTWHTAMNNRQADENLRQSRETATLIEQARRIAGVAAVAPAAWMHEFKDPHTGERRHEPRLHKPKDYELLPGETVRPLAYADGVQEVPDARR